MPQALLERAARQGEANGTTPLQELFALGLDRRQYWSMLADELGVCFTEDLSDAALVSSATLLTTEAVRLARSVLVRFGRRMVLVTAPGGDDVAVLRRRLKARPGLRKAIMIAPPEVVRAFVAARRRAALTYYSLNRLSGVLPGLSAGRQCRRGVSGPTALVAAAFAIVMLAPVTSIATFLLLSTLYFANCSVWKLITALGRSRRLRLEPCFDNRLPTYAVLVPLYREAAIVEDLVARLRRLDYPGTKLQVMLILETDDRETRSAVARHVDDPCFEVIVVPRGGPRTKPKALTYALSFVRSEYVVVFDAEDRPESDQLRKAVAAFRDRPSLGCVQARLAPDNRDSWLSRMFAIEYAANFEVVLPSLAAWCVPLPLGGTSNHFPLRVLEEVGAWDPYNVTEDADLGMRLARFGYQTATIVSRTYEEAPVTFRQWLPQRRRWIKVWMQTVAVCLGRGISPGLKLPLRQQLAVHGVLAAGVAGLLLYPASLVVVAAALVCIYLGRGPTDFLDWLLLILNLANISVVLFAALVSSVRGLFLARSPGLICFVPMLPLYWALMSLAAWQALFQFFRAPSAWEKTAHGVARRRRTPGDSLPGKQQTVRSKSLLERAKKRDGASYG